VCIKTGERGKVPRTKSRDRKWTGDPETIFDAPIATIRSAGTPNILDRHTAGKRTVSGNAAAGGSRQGDSLTRTIDTTSASHNKVGHAKTAAIGSAIERPIPSTVDAIEYCRLAGEYDKANQ
jgi:hypothetical protein